MASRECQRSSAQPQGDAGGPVVDRVEPFRLFVRMECEQKDGAGSIRGHPRTRGIESQRAGRGPIHNGLAAAGVEVPADRPAIDGQRQEDFLLVPYAPPRVDLHLSRVRCVHAGRVYAHVLDDFARDAIRSGHAAWQPPRVVRCGVRPCIEPERARGQVELEVELGEHVASHESGERMERRGRRLAGDQDFVLQRSGDSH